MSEALHRLVRREVELLAKVEGRQAGYPRMNAEVPGWFHRPTAPKAAKALSMRCVVEPLGIMDYAEALELQRQKVVLRKAQAIPDTLLLLEHPHVYTLGRNARREHLLISRDQLAGLSAQVFETDRGGDITYHGPGQLVGYPILDLSRHRRDLGWYMHSLEEVFVRLAESYGIRARRISGARGVWVGEAKLVAMGVHVSRWVTSHGFALNVSTDLGYFGWIVPCGLHGKGVTSLERLLGRSVPMEEAAGAVIKHFGEVFDLEMESPRALIAGRD